MYTHQNYRGGKRKQGQLEMGESIFIVIIIILIIIFGLIFASGAERDEITRQQQRFQELDAITKAQYITSLKELTCSEFEVTQTSCFDKHKVEAFARLTHDDWSLVQEYYYEQFGDACIFIHRIDTDTGGSGITELNCNTIVPNPEKLWLVYNNSARRDPSQGRPVIIPVSLFDSTTRTNDFGVLTIIPYE